jgi:hypothetical protein
MELDRLTIWAGSPMKLYMISVIRSGPRCIALPVEGTRARWDCRRRLNVDRSPRWRGPDPVHCRGVTPYADPA